MLKVEPGYEKLTHLSTERLRENSTYLCTEWLRKIKLLSD